MTTPKDEWEILATMPDPPSEGHALTFRTYWNYVKAWNLLIETEYAPGAKGLRTRITSHPRFSALHRASVDIAQVERHLRAAWSTELAMRMFLKSASAQAVRYGNVWVPVQGYYAVFAAGRALAVASGQTVDSHRGVLDWLVGEVKSREWLGVPWIATCSGCPQTGSEKYSGVPTLPKASLSNLAAPVDDADAWVLVRQSLRTTRERSLEEAFVQWRRQNKRKALRKAEKENIAKGKAPTSVFEFMYRIRIRSNYRDTDAFALGPWRDEDARAFYESIVGLTGYCLRFLESIVLGRLGPAEFTQVIEAFERSARVDRSSLPAASYWLDPAPVSIAKGARE